MRSFIILACVIVCAKAIDQALIDELKTQVQEYGIECAESEKATPEDVEALMNHKAPPTHAGRCVVFCVSKKMNLMNEDGTVAVPKSEWLDKVKADDPEAYEKMQNLYTICKERVEAKSDGCDSAMELVSCVKYEGEKSGLDKYLA
nr:odorant binding protein 9 [Pagiophloeus tsushimanus]